MGKRMRACRQISKQEARQIVYAVNFIFLPVIDCCLQVPMSFHFYFSYGSLLSNHLVFIGIRFLLTCTSISGNNAIKPCASIFFW